MGLGTEQLDYLRAMSVDVIPRGAEVPPDVLDRFIFPRDTVAEFGGGTGDKAFDIARRGVDVTVFEVNRKAVEAARGLGLLAYVADVSDLAAIRKGNSPVKTHQYNVIVAEGLLCNLMKTAFENTLIVARNALKPGGRFLIADVQTAEEINPLLLDTFGAGAYHTWQKDWIARYRANHEAGLPNHHFLVCAPGTHKDIEWGDASVIRRLRESGQYERYARHIPVRQLQSNLYALGFEERYRADAVWTSRTGAKLAGFVGVWEVASVPPLRRN